MVEEKNLNALSAALPEYEPRLLPFGGVYRLSLTYAPGKSVEVSVVTPDHYVLRNVELDDTGQHIEFMVAVMYGLALIPTVVRAFVAHRASVS